LYFSSYCMFRFSVHVSEPNFSWRWIHCDSLKQRANVGNPARHRCWQQRWGNCDEMSRICTWCTMRCRDSPFVVDHQPFGSLPITTALGKKRNLPKQNSVHNRRAEFAVGYCLVLRKAKRGTAGEIAYWIQCYRTVYFITSSWPRIDSPRWCFVVTTIPPFLPS